MKSERNTIQRLNVFSKSGTFSRCLMVCDRQKLSSRLKTTKPYSMSEQKKSSNGSFFPGVHITLGQNNSFNGPTWSVQPYFSGFQAFFGHRKLPVLQLFFMFFRRWVTLSLLLLLTAGLPGFLYAQDLDRPPLDIEVDYSPADGDISGTNPPAFIWLPATDIDSYMLQYSPTRSFDPEHTITVRDIDLTIHVPVETLEPGVWYWRYGYHDGMQDRFSNVRQFEIPETAVDFPLVTADEMQERIPGHRPRLFFSPEQVEDIRTDTDGRYDFLYPVIDEARDILAMDEPLFPEPDPWPEENYRPIYTQTWQAMRPYTQRMLISALAYLYTGDERFADEARRRLMHFMTWDVDGPSSALWPTELGMDIAKNAYAVFDWIYDVLSEDEIQRCKEVLTARMEQIHREVHRARPMESRPYSSHPGRMVGYVVEAGIVLAHEVPEAREWLDYTLKLLWSTYPAWGGDDGGWHEGVSYWMHYMNSILRVVAELDRYGIPLKEKPFFRNTGFFGLYAGYPHRPTRAFGDEQIRPIDINHGRVMYDFSSLYKNPYFRWHSEISGVENPSERAALLYHDPDLQSRSPGELPQSRVFHDVGIVAMHSHMADPENNVLMLFKSNPLGAISHNHASQNAFIIEAFGEPLAISSGSRQGHGSPSHREWMWQTKAHNSILVDGDGQVPRRRSSSGEIIAYEEHGDYVYAAGDATRAYGGRLEQFHRHILFLRPDYFIIIDDLISAKNASTYQWLLHGPTEFQIDRTANVLISRSGNARLTTRFLTPQNLDYRQHTGFTPEMQRPSAMWNQFHLTASTLQAEVSQRFVSVMRVDRIPGEPVLRPEPPSTSRREIDIQAWDDSGTPSQVLLQAKLLQADGGVALRLGNDLILWRETGQEQITAHGVTSTRDVTVKKDFFR